MIGRTPQIAKIALAVASIAVGLNASGVFSDRAEVARCINKMIQGVSSGRQEAYHFMDYDALVAMRRDLDAADVVVVTNRRDRQVGGQWQTYLEYDLDGRFINVLCIG